jgi:murein DD-endopeptidase MepM/ murein hydrolase activator NlpD
MFRGIVRPAIVLGAVLFAIALVSAVRYRPRGRAASLADEPSLAPEAPAHAPIGVLPADLQELDRKSLRFPVLGFDTRRLRDTFGESRGTRLHGALDILAPRGTPVLAVDDGIVAKLHNSVGKGGLSIYHFDPTEMYCYYYAHLDRYADGLKDGAALKKGDVLGYVGTTGNAPPQTPHLHFAIYKLGPEKRWGTGVPINAFGLWATRRAAG